MCVHILPKVRYIDRNALAIVETAIKLFEAHAFSAFVLQMSGNIQTDFSQTL